uniref:Uncharacterized protein n=1 Tax=Panagrellus redivivus TaxID=6233 RepID=A0A7E4UQB0_PANRE
MPTSAPKRPRDDDRNPDNGGPEKKRRQLDADASSPTTENPIDENPQPALISDNGETTQETVDETPAGDTVPPKKLGYFEKIIASDPLFRDYEVDYLLYHELREKRCSSEEPWPVSTWYREALPRIPYRLTPRQEDKWMRRTKALRNIENRTHVKLARQYCDKNEWDNVLKHIDKALEDMEKFNYAVYW